MLIQFKVGNFRSFKDIATLSMVASAIKEHEENNVFSAGNLRLLKNIALYGANASGKSNLIKAMLFMRNFVLHSSKDLQVKEKIKIKNFRLSEETEKLPSFFEIIFIFKDIRYRYGFQVDRDRIYREWLFFVPKRQEVKLFIRENDNFDIGSQFQEGHKLDSKTRLNALFLSVVAQFNGKISGEILEWFSAVGIITGVTDPSCMHFTVQQLKNKKFRQNILNFLKYADFGIEDVVRNETKINVHDIPEEILKDFESKDLNEKKEFVRVNVNTVHKKYSKNNKHTTYEKFELESEESDGTKKFFSLAGPILDTLQRGSVTIVDELDARLHPLFIQFLVSLFNSPRINPKNAQLIFASHNTHLLHREVLRRDQIWFTEKNRYGASNLYSLVDYNVRKNASFEKDYMFGKYGAVPIINDINSFSFEDSNGF